MSVFTKVKHEELARWLRRYDVGEAVELQGIAEGIENTNYFLTTTAGRYVLTLFERMSGKQLPFYLGLMEHLAGAGLPCPAPLRDSEGAPFSVLNGKPAAIVTRLSGRPVLAPSAQHCGQVGEALARLHLAARSYAGTLPNPRGLAWWQATAQKVAPFLDAPRRALLQAELDDQSVADTAGLPRGAIHADLFRDNVLWDDAEGAARLSGIIDFYFAGIDTWLFDVAVAVNDWCARPDGELDSERTGGLLAAYARMRPFEPAEHVAWPLMLRAAALRFWLSRLFDFYLPRAGELTHAHDPEHFRRILRSRRTAPAPLSLLMDRD